MKVIDKILPDNQYCKEITKKDTIYIHHTAGGHRADRQIGYWSTDNLGKVATSYVIGGMSTRDKNDSSFDGAIYRAFDDQFWGYHLGLKTATNLKFNRKSIGIELCNYGLLKNVSGEYITYVSSEIPSDMAYKMAGKFKGFDYAHKYTDKQIQALKELILDIANRHSINVNKTWDFKTFDLDKEKALAGVPGIYTHVNVRTDKFDCHPQPELIDMLNSL